ncbi:glycoside hydrolase family 6 protein [Actinoplanes couchii]|uniref:Glucanase n=1 Tax=Actinoplanes couchii TaxID=403638 RepID=A0ABQ3XES0_9ACTN|nr:glycoside hydrolase family 6 protein [Actinoplanes couchii]MDR6319871.1 endoglucanase [Actinoplanes couchii]GID57006.1 glucanase [Actinoplanes couchii]
MSRSRIAAAAACAAVVATSVLIVTGSASAGTISGTLYRDPDTAVARWLSANPGDSRATVIRDKIASQPATRWLSNFNIATVGAEVAGYVTAAEAAGQIPALTVYGITNRDCGGASSGGAPDLTQYQTWIGNIARNLGTRTVVLNLEPDSIALLTCLNSSEIAARNQALRTATQTLKAANPNAKVYLDGGHSAWNSAGDQASRLVAAGIASADGFYTNASNFQPTSAEAAYGRSIISALNGQGATGKRQVIDVSRNGGASGDWCGDDNTDRRIGQYPTVNTGDANIDAYLWIKPPGEADGCRYAAGSFQPDLAYSLASTAPNPPSSPPPPSSPSTSPSSSPSSSPSPSSPAGSCGATLRATSTWNGGYQGEVTVRAGTVATSGWTVSWTLPAGSTIAQAWNGTLTSSGSTVTVRNVSWNGSVPAGGSTTFGFTASGTPGTPAVTCTSP